MVPLAVDFDNLHQILRNLYVDMMPLCSNMIGVAKGVAGLGALFYVANRVWQALSRAEPIDLYPLLRPFALGLCIMFFPSIVLGTLNTVMSPVVKGTHTILESQMTDVTNLQAKRDRLEYEARLRSDKAWLVNSEVFDQKLEELGVFDTPEILGMYLERTWYNFKQWINDCIRAFFELLFHAAALVIDTIRTFFLLVLAILGPIAFAISVYDGFQASLSQWISRYVSVYLWLPVSDLFSAILSRIQGLMLQQEITLLEDPTFIPDGSTVIYIIFMIIGIMGYFTIPTVSSWIIQSGGLGSSMRMVNQAGARGSGFAGGLSGAIAGNSVGRAGNVAGKLSSTTSSARGGTSSAGTHGNLARGTRSDSNSEGTRGNLKNK